MQTKIIELLLAAKTLPSTNKTVQLSVAAETKRLAELLDKEPQDKDAQIEKLQKSLKWAFDNMNFMEYPYESSEYEFCSICMKQWSHKPDCEGIKQINIIKTLLED